MSEIDTGKLIELRERAKRKSLPEWRRLDLSEMQLGSYLAADPSLSAFGLVLFEVGQRRWTVQMAETFRVPQQETGWEDILNRAEKLGTLLHGYLTRWVKHTDWGRIRAVHESPPIGHGRLINPEIALIASREFRRATVGYERLPMVRRQDHAKLICGDANADKKVHHLALKSYLPAMDGGNLITNEATRDALSVAMFAAQRGF